MSDLARCTACGQIMWNWPQCGVCEMPLRRRMPLRWRIAATTGQLSRGVKEDDLMEHGAVVAIWRQNPASETLLTAAHVCSLRCAHIFKHRVRAYLQEEENIQRCKSLVGGLKRLVQSKGG